MNSPGCLEVCSSQGLSGSTLKSAATNCLLGPTLELCSSQGPPWSSLASVACKGFSRSHLRGPQQPRVFSVPLHPVPDSHCFSADGLTAAPDVYRLHKDGQERRPRNTDELLMLCSRVTHDLSRQASATNSHKPRLTNVGYKKAIFT